MRTIYKYQLGVLQKDYQEFTLGMKKGCELLKVTEQDGTHVLYVKLESEAMPESQTFCLVWTGCEIVTDRQVQYIDTFTRNGLVYHLFRILK